MNKPLVVIKDWKMVEIKKSFRKESSFMSNDWCLLFADQHQVQGFFTRFQFQRMTQLGLVY